MRIYVVESGDGDVICLDDGKMLLTVNSPLNRGGRVVNATEET